MKTRKILALVLVMTSVLFFAPSLMAKGGSSDSKGQGQSADSSSKGQGQSVDGTSKGQGQSVDASSKGQGGSGDKAQSQSKSQTKQQTKQQTQKREQKRLQKREQKKTQSKQQKQQKSQSKDQSKQGENQDKGQGTGNTAQAPEIPAAANVIEGEGVIVETEGGYSLDMGQESYSPLNLQEKFKQDGLSVIFKANLVSEEDKSISLIEISAVEETVEDAPTGSDKQAKEGKIQQDSGNSKQQGKSKLSDAF